METISESRDENVVGSSLSNSDAAVTGIVEQSKQSYEKVAEASLVLTPQGSKLWIPNCDDDAKPVVGMKFPTVEDGYEFYKSYARSCGFNVRKSTKKRLNRSDVVNLQQFVCSNEGYKDTKHCKTSRKRLSTRSGCKARMVMKFCGDDGTLYEVTKFFEGHSHSLYSDSQSLFEKEGRNMNVFHKKMIIDNSRVNVGPCKSFRLCKEYMGGYENVGASKQDFKNFLRDLKAFVKDTDSQMFIDNFRKKNQMWSAFFFDFQVDGDGCLNRVFWCDPNCRKNYSAFGDIVSFDTTYRTNKYNMVFGPFTGVDNHFSCVTFAACFIAKEDTESFDWVFRSFLKAMDGKEPACLVTDQDPAMKMAIDKVFNNTKHRFCLWHIMRKMSDKLGRTLMEGSDCRRRISSLVWNEHIEPSVFEYEWNKIITDYDLMDHPWLSNLYGIRDMWIPAFFRDVPMSGLMKTTSRSESENSFFTSFTNPFLNLVEFYLRFETCLDSQRHNQEKNDHDSELKHPELKTPLGIEKHAMDVYTNSAFYVFQEELVYACFNCGGHATKVENGFQYHIVKCMGIMKDFEVQFEIESHITTCSCKMFDRKGIPCRHIIFVWRLNLLDRIPENYILPRWCKFPFIKIQLDVDLAQQCSSINAKKNLINSLWSDFHACVYLANRDDEDLLNLARSMKEYRGKLESKKISNRAESKSKKVEDMVMLTGFSVPDEVTIKPPKISKNKGTGVHSSNTRKDKRLKSHKEIAIEESSKKKRICKKCNQIGGHDTRNCRNIPSV